MRRFIPVAMGAVWTAVPLFPAFISLTSVAFPGVSLVPAPIVFAVLGSVCVLAIYGLAMLARYPEPGSFPLAKPLLLVLGATILAALAGFDPLAGALFVGIFGLGIVWHWSIVRFYREPYVADVIAWSFLVSGGAAGLAAIVMVVTRLPVALYVIAHGRAVGTFILPGELAAYLVIFLPIAYAVARTTPQRALRAVAWTAGIVGLAALYLTHSRAGWMGFAAAVGVLVASQMRRRLHAATAAAIVLAAGAAAVLLLFNANHNPSEDYTRLSIWQAAVQIVQRFPLTGVGPFDFSRLYAIFRLPDGEPTAFHGHSIYLTFLAELGVVGAAAVLWSVWAFANALRASLPRAKPAAALLSLAAVAGLVGVSVQGLIDTMSIVIFGLWLPTMGLAIAAARVERDDA